MRPLAGSVSGSRLIYIHAAHTALAEIRPAHSASTSSPRLRSALRLAGARRECRVLGRKVIAAARWALDPLGFGASPHKLFELGPAVVASIFEDRHAFKLAACALACASKQGVPQRLCQKNLLVLPHWQSDRRVCIFRNKGLPLPSTYCCSVGGISWRRNRSR